jgi:hypothetical protein
MLRSLGASAPVVLVAEKPVVLVVEENAIFRAATAKRLRSAGFEVFEATNSAEAEPVLKNTPIDAVVDIPINQWLRAGRNRSVPATRSQPGTGEHSAGIRRGARTADHRSGATHRSSRERQGKDRPRRAARARRRSAANQLFACSAGTVTVCSDGNSSAGDPSQVNNSAPASATSETASRSW